MASIDKVRIDPKGASGGVFGALRGLVASQKAVRDEQLLAAAAQVLPLLQTLERKAIEPDKQVLAGRTLAALIADDHAIERGLTMFEAAWKLGLVEMTPSNPSRSPSPLPYGSRGIAIAPCGVDFNEVEAWFVRRAAHLIFKANPGGLEMFRVAGRDLAALPRLRILARISPATMREWHDVLSVSFDRFVEAEMPIERLETLCRFDAVQIRGLRSALGRQVADMLDWPTDRLAAIADGLTTYDQLADLGPEITEVRDAAAIRALGRWDMRDITDKVNEERRKRDKPPLKGTRFETDIGVLRRMLGKAFATIIMQPAETLDVFGAMLRELRGTSGVKDRQDAAQTLKLFTDRYIHLMTVDTIAALRLRAGETGPDSDGLTLREAMGLLDGLWGKQGLGRRFMEMELPTAEGTRALAGVVARYIDMRKRGSVKPTTDLAAILVKSDVLDPPIAKFIK